MKIEKICIVGGGSAGWITASTLIKSHPWLDITVIDSPDIPTIGVGESTTQLFRDWCKEMNISDVWMDECEATYKYSVKFENFSEYGDFHYPFYDGAPPSNSSCDILEWFFHLQATGGKPDMSFAEWMVPYWKIIEDNKVVVDQFQSFDYTKNSGYHLDAVKFTKWLKREFCGPRGVKHHHDTIQDCEKDESGNITTLIGNKHEYDADLFIDCTGFKSLLLGEYMGVEWEEFPWLINNRAWAARVKYIDKKTEMLNHTKCTALDNGWVWHVPLTTRMGIGYNFSNKFCSDEEALKEFKEYLGDHEIIGEPRLIEWRNGVSKEIWHKNVVGIGLAGGFIEPLESNGLLSVHNFAIFLADSLSVHNGKVNTLIRDQFNHRSRKQFISFAHFVANHYMMTTRDDTPYWKYISEDIDYLSDMARDEYRAYPFDKFPLRMDQISDWNFQNLAGNSYIAAGHRHTPATEWTCDYMDKRNNIDLASFVKLSSGYQLSDEIIKEIDKFPEPWDFYYEDVAGIDNPYYEHG
jgi:tryptophan halogenase|tara:strand:- start:6677 stop:8242 length:1566 start_codon:yes stop_codon:yes gene_type:complete